MLMKLKNRWLSLGTLLVFSILAALLVSGAAVPIPQMRVLSVADNTVTGHGWDFPAGATFDIRMAPFGTRGLGGDIIGNGTVAADGTINFSVEVPDSLRSHSRIAIRLDGFLNYYSFAWFYFAPTQETVEQESQESAENEEEEQAEQEAVTPEPVNVYRGFPTIDIETVRAVDEVGALTLQGINMPPNQTFTVRINSMWTQGMGGVNVATFDTGDGGDMTIEVEIPAQFRSASRAAVRVESPAGYYAYNWFHMGAAYLAPTNTGVATGGNTGQGGQTATGGRAIGAPATNAPAAAAVYPTMMPIAVSRGTDVTVSLFNLPKDMEFTVVMGHYGTQGLSGYHSTTFNSGDGGDQVLTFPIPSEIAGVGRIAVRIQGIDNPYYSFAWFWN